MKTRRLLGWVAMATMVLSTGCSSDEVVNDYSPKNAIQFGIYVGRDASSRVAVTDLDEVKKDGFGVFANYSQGNTTGTNPNFMNNEDVHWEADATDNTKSQWTYSPIKYWPNNDNDKVTFWAYSPYSSDANVANFTAPIFRIYDGTDYVAAGPVTHTKQSVDEKVTFNFTHMMSRIGFKVEAIVDELEHTKDDNGKEDETNTGNNTSEEADNANNSVDSYTNIVVKEVTLNGTLSTSGTMTWNNNNWVLTNDAASSHSHTLTAVNFESANYHGYEEVTTDNVKETKTVQGQSVTEDESKLNNDESYLMLIPQNVGINLKVEYWVITRDENLATGYSCVKNIVQSTDFNFNFERGKAYNFVLHLGLTSVKFEATVSEWDETNATEHIVNVPINTSTSTTQP